MATDPQQAADTALTGDQSDATPPGLKEMRETAVRWCVEWVDGTDRETTLAGIAWYAREFGEEATVPPLIAK